MKFIIFLSCLAFGSALGVPGGWSTVSVDDETVNRLAGQAVAHHNKVSNSLFFKKLVTIKSAKSQVVAGMNYEVTFLIGETDCSKSQATVNEVCQISANKTPEECIYVFWLPIYSDEAQITRATCSRVEQ